MKKESRGKTGYTSSSKYDGFIRYRNTSILVSVLIIVIFFLFFRNNLNETVYVETLETVLYLKAYTGEELSVAYQDIQKITLYDTFEPGEQVSGSDNLRVRSGVWQNDTWGEYQLFDVKKIDGCIALETSDEVIVFNYESDSVTQQLFESLQEFLSGKEELNIEYSRESGAEE